jgi:hypothetical protein
MAAEIDLRKEDSAPRPDGMARTQFLENAGIGRRQIRQCELAQDEPFEHRLLDYPARHLFVGAHWEPVRLDTRFLDGRLLR